MAEKRKIMGDQYFIIKLTHVSQNFPGSVTGVLKVGVHQVTILTIEEASRQRDESAVQAKAP